MIPTVQRFIIDLRCRLLLQKMRVPVDNKKVDVDAWTAKKFLVLLKRKLNRKQVPRVAGFQELLAALSHDDDNDPEADSLAVQAC